MAYVHPSRKAQLGKSSSTTTTTSTTGKKKRKKRPVPSTVLEDGTFSGATSSSSALRNRIRSQKKLLGHSTRLPADVRQEKEREVRSLEAQLEQLLAQRERAHTLGKYHMVRFFERRKAERAVKRWSKAAAAAAAPVDVEAAARLREAQIDLAYAQNAPLAKKYKGLFAKNQSPIDIADADTLDAALDAIRESKPPLWTLIEQAMADGTLERVRAGTHKGLAALGLAAQNEEDHGMDENEDEHGTRHARQPDSMTTMDRASKRTDRSGKKQLATTNKVQERQSRHASESTAKKDGRGGKNMAGDGKSDGSGYGLEHGHRDEDEEMSDGGFFEI